MMKIKNGHRVLLSTGLAEKRTKRRSRWFKTQLAAMTLQFMTNPRWRRSGIDCSRTLSIASSCSTECTHNSENWLRTCTCSRNARMLTHSRTSSPGKARKQLSPARWTSLRKPIQSLRMMMSSLKEATKRRRPGRWLKWK